MLITLSLGILLLSLGCHPHEGVTPHLFYLSDLVSPLFFINLPTNNFFFGCHPLEGVTRGGPPPPALPLVTPLTGRMLLLSLTRSSSICKRHAVTKLRSSNVAKCEVPRARTSPSDRSFTAAGPRIGSETFSLFIYVKPVGDTRGGN